MKAIKENKVYKILESEKDAYLKSGFDIYNDDGKPIEKSSQATVPYSSFKALEEENAKLKSENIKLTEANKTLKAENATLKKGSE